MFRKSLMGGLVALAVIVGLVPGGTALAADSASVAVPDGGLRSCINETLGQSDSAQISAAQIESLTILECFDRGIERIDGIEFAKNLYDLNFTSNRIVSVSRLAGLQQLASLSLGDNNISDVSSLKTLGELEYLNLGGNEITDPSDLSGISSLKSLYLNSNQIADVASLDTLPGLTVLDLGRNRISDVSSLAGLQSVKSLSLENNLIANVAALEPLKNLEQLRIGWNKVTGLQVVSTLTKLQVLDATANRVSTLDGISGAVALKELYLGDNQISDLAALAGVQGLEILNIDNNAGITSLAGLAGLRKLQSLSLNSTSVADLVPVSGMGDLSILEASYSDIGDLEPLRGLSTLRSLRLDANRIVDLAPLRDLIRLERLSLGQNRIFDLSPLGELPRTMEMFADSQLLWQPTVRVGEPTVNPLRNLQGTVIAAEEQEQCVDGSCQQLVFSAPADRARTRWNLDLMASGFSEGSTSFSGQLLRNVVDDSTPPVQKPTIAVEYAEVAAGEQQIVTGTHFDPNTAVSFRLDPGALSLGTAVADAAGNVLYRFTVPSELAAGAYGVTATQSAKLAEAGFRVTSSVVHPPSYKPSLLLKSAKLTAGAKQTASASGFAPHHAISFTLQPTGVQVATSSAGVDGRASVAFVLPMTLKSGTYSVVAVQDKLSARASFNVTAPAAPKELPVCTPARKLSVFADTPISHKFYKEIDWMHCMGYSTGWRQPSGRPVYKPSDGLERAAMAAFIFRMEAPKNYNAPRVSPFADVSPKDSFYREIAWMFESGLSTGWYDPTGKPNFRPHSKLSREAMAAFIFRLEGASDYRAPKTSPMVDMKAGMKFYREISWMYEQGLSTGNRTPTGKKYLPKEGLSRQAMAAFIYRLVLDYRVSG